MATTSNPRDIAAIIQHTEFDPTTIQRISHRAVPQQPPTIQEPDPEWPSHFAALESRIRGVLGEKALAINHVGSTSVPGLPAKPVIDIDVVVADPADEASYVPALGGDRGAGLQFILREPEWHQHRFFVCADPVANVHVFGPGASEVVRHRIFTDWLVEHPEDRERYAAVKREAAAASREAGETVQDYNLRKEFVIREILDRAFRAEGLLQ
ncbi:GrpB protein-domain-containing protein [Diaporthe sp. PMI_573]|nr:GrpB protein-domain-containing protein [Diaporthaceae sp. PMI_573]